MEICQFTPNLQIYALFVTVSTSLLLVSSVCGHFRIHHSGPFVCQEYKITAASIFALEYLKQFTTLFVKVAQLETGHQVQIQARWWCPNRDPSKQCPVRFKVSKCVLEPRQCPSVPFSVASAGFVPASVR